VGEGCGVGAREVDVVVDLPEGGFARERHLAGVVLADGDVLDRSSSDISGHELHGNLCPSRLSMMYTLPFLVPIVPMYFSFTPLTKHGIYI
jgi:hypothetical protein